jgi:uncharacterized protein with beta-barrel porin domain
MRRFTAKFNQKFFLWMLPILPVVGSADVAFVTTFTPNNVYALSLTSGAWVGPINTGGVFTGFPSGIAISGATAYVPNSLDSVYSLPLESGPWSKINASGTFSGSNPRNIAISGATAYMPNNLSGTLAAIISIPLAGGPWSQIASSGTFSGQAYSIAISGTNAYVTNLETDTLASVFSLPLAGGIWSQINTGGSISQAYNIAISGTTAYVTSSTNGSSVFSLPLAGGLWSNALNTGTTISDAFGIATSEDFAYVTDTLNNDVYSLPLVGGPWTKINTANISGTTDSIAIVPDIQTKGLKGQEKKVANYLNRQFNNLFLPTFSTVPLLSSLSGKELQTSLKKVCPARLATSIFAANNALFAVSQVVETHTRNQHVARLRRTVQPGSTSSLDLNAQLTDASETVPFKATTCCPPQPCSVWIEGLGVFAREHAQLQTPAFKTSTGGFVAAVEGYGNFPNPIGGGLAYTHTHLKWKGGYGTSTIEQEYGFLYGTFDITCNFYIDASIWLEFFQIHNHRRIAFPGFKATEHSDPKGFQFAPHLAIGYEFDWCWFSLEPFAMFDWVNSWEHRSRETGHGFNFGVKGQYSGMLRSEVGLRFYETVTCRWGQIIIQERASYVNKEPFHVGTVNAFLVGTPGSFTVETLTGPQNLGLFEMEFLFTSTDMRYPYGSISYQGEFGSSYISNQIMLEIGQDF